MALELRGKLIKVLQEQKGVGKNGEWKKQDFVIETIDAYPKKVCFTVWNDKLSLLESIQPDDELRIMFSVASREYNEKWYTDVTAYAVEKVAGTHADETASAPNNIDAANDAIATISSEEDGDDDLPF
ncbi:MAG: DUF3127 domain-containing protein [Thermonemataceae bacterium]